MSQPNSSLNPFPDAQRVSEDPFAMQLALSRVHARLVPMRQHGEGYALDHAAQSWFELPAGRGLAGYGLSRALRMLLDVLRGLTALHDTFSSAGLQFAHGEVAVTQFRVDFEGVCRLVPLTARHSGDDQVAPAHAAIGHMAPERLLGEAIDPRADVFSAGVLLWEALAGRRLFEESTAEAIIDRLMGGKLPMPQLPPELAWAIPLKSVAARALAVDPYQRFHDCAELATAIAIVTRERVASHEEIASFFGSSARPSARPRDSQRSLPAEASTLTQAPRTSSGPRTQRSEGSVVSAQRERPVPSQSSTFMAVSAPASNRAAKVSTLAPLGPASSRPPALVTPAPSALPSQPPASAVTMPASVRPAWPSAAPTRSLSPAPSATRIPPHKSPFSSLLELHAQVTEAELELDPGPVSLRMPPTYQHPAEQAAAAEPAPLSSHSPPPLPAPLLTATTPEAEPSPATLSPLVSALRVALDSDEQVLIEAAAFRSSSSRKLWAAFAVAAVGGALAVAALTHGSSQPKRVVSAPAAAPRLDQVSNVLAAPASDHAGKPLPVSTPEAVSPSANTEKAPHAPPAARAQKSAASVKASQPAPRDYGI